MEMIGMFSTSNTSDSIYIIGPCKLFEKTQSFVAIRDRRKHYGSGNVLNSNPL